MKLFRAVAALAIAGTCLMASAAPSLARGGGFGGGHSSGGGFHGGGGHSSGDRRPLSPEDQARVNSVMTVCMGVMSFPLVVVVGYFFFRPEARKRRQDIKEAKQTLARLRHLDPAWDPAALRRFIEECYMGVQAAWANGTMSSAQGWATDRLIASWDAKLSGYARQNRRNMCERIRFGGAKVVLIEDRLDDARDMFWALVSGTMVDYMVDTTTGRVAEGSSAETTRFEEAWKFVRTPAGWRLDEVARDYDIDKALSGQSVVELPASVA